MNDTGLETTETAQPILADIEAGFNQEVNVPTEKPAQPESAKVEASEPAPAEPEDSVIEIKASEWKSLQDRLDKSEADVRKVFGQYGGMKNFVEEKLKSVPTSMVGGEVRVNPKALERLKEDYGDELADIFATFIESGAKNEAKHEAKPEVQTAAPAVNQEEIDRRVAEAADRIKEEVSQDATLKMIQFRHKDATAVLNSPEMELWLNTLPVDEANEFLNSWDAEIVSDKLDQFKAWNAKRSKNADRLSGAVQTKPSVRTAPARISEDQAIKEGFDSVFKT